MHVYNDMYTLYPGRWLARLVLAVAIGTSDYCSFSNFCLALGVVLHIFVFIGYFVFLRIISIHILALVSCFFRNRARYPEIPIVILLWHAANGAFSRTQLSAPRLRTSLNRKVSE